MYLFLISKASYRYFPSHVKHWQSSLLNKNDHIWCMSRERNPLYLTSILLNSCLHSPSYNTQWNKRWISSSKTKHTLHSRSCTGIISEQYFEKLFESLINKWNAFGRSYKQLLTWLSTCHFTGVVRHTQIYWPKYSNKDSIALTFRKQKTQFWWTHIRSIIIKLPKLIPSLLHCN